VLATTLVVTAPGGARALPRPAPGDLVPRIQCPPGFKAKVLTQGLLSPDGLAIDRSGIVHVVEERAGRVSAIDAEGSVTPVLEGLNSPEGIAAHAWLEGLYVVEDVEDGRLLSTGAGGSVLTLAQGLEAPEGVSTITGDPVYVTESNLQFAGVENLRTRVTAVTAERVTRVITNTPVLSGTSVQAWSYAGITSGPDGRLYVTNELSGVEISRTVVLVPGDLTTTLTLSTTDSVFAIDPNAGTRELIATDLIAPEGLSFSADGEFPLYVAEEDVGGGRGRISLVDADGGHAPLCTGFMTIEDIAIDDRGTLYVSEDGSGMVIQIVPPPTAPGELWIWGPDRTLVGRSERFNAHVQPYLATWPLTFTWHTGESTTQSSVEGIEASATLSWSLPGPQSMTVTVENVAGSISAVRDITVLDNPGIRWHSFLPLVLVPM
jgi:glucose/arabinose dehydrogenase